MRRCIAKYRALTFIELLLAMAVMAMVIGTLGAVGSGMRQSYNHTDGYGQTVQHARVALERIARTVNQATANEQFPGFIVVARQVGTARLPEALVVWRPAGASSDAGGLPRFNELVIFCPDQTAPNRLLEITVPSDARVVPAINDTNAWRNELNNIQSRSDAQRIVLTDIVRTVVLGAGASSAVVGCIRFEQRLSPSEVQWAQYRAGTLDWTSLTWPQGMFSPGGGIRQAWMRCEIQLVPPATSAVDEGGGRRPVPFFGSAAVYYRLPR